MPQRKKGAKRSRSLPSSPGSASVPGSPPGVPADGNSKPPSAGIGDLSFEASERAGETITIDEALVAENLGETADDEDLIPYDM